jgi:hypothetical protein
LKIPAPYYDRLRSEYPDLLSTTINYLLPIENTRHLVRTLDGQARAFLSDRYRPIDYEDTADALLKALLDRQANVRSSQITETHMYVKATIPGLRGTVVVPNKVGQQVEAGVCFRNSEVGAGAIRVDFFVCVLACLNGMVVDKTFRKAHLGRRASEDLMDEGFAEFYKDDTRKADDQALMLKIRDAVDNCLDRDRFQKWLDRANGAAQDDAVGRADLVVEEIASRYELTEAERGGILGHLIRGGDLSRWGFSQAITRHAGDEAVSYERSTALEELGGRLIELPRTDWKVLGETAEQRTT